MRVDKFDQACNIVPRLVLPGHLYMMLALAG